MGSIVFSVGDLTSDSAVRTLKLVGLCDVQGGPQLVQSVTFCEQVVEAVIVGVILIIKVRDVHLIFASDWLGDVIQNILAEAGLVRRLKLQTARLFTVATQYFDLLSLEVIIQSEGPTDLMLLHSLRRCVNERVRKYQVVEVELIGV